MLIASLLAHSTLRRWDTSARCCLDARFDTFACLDADSSLASLVRGHFNASGSTMLIPSMLVRLDIFHAWPTLLLLRSCSN